MELEGISETAGHRIAFVLPFTGLPNVLGQGVDQKTSRLSQPKQGWVCLLDTKNTKVTSATV